MNCTVLISSAGRRVELLRCFREDARALGVNLRVIATDARPEWSAACQDADAAYSVPRCSSPDFVDRLLEICRNESVDLLVPTIDTELLLLSSAKARFAAAGTHVAVSGLDTVALARNKWATAEFLATHGLPSPKTVLLSTFLATSSSLRFPLILKPIGGSSSVGIHSVERVDEIAPLGLDASNYVAQEKWSGSEYTVNLFFNASGALRCAVPHLRLETRGGEVSKGRTERMDTLEAVARKLAAVLPNPEGALCFQAIVAPDGSAVVFEINARFGGGFPLAHRAGAPFSRWLLEETLGLPSSASNSWKPGVTMLRFDAAVFGEAVLS